jgi:hypothetical protein
MSKLIYVALCAVAIGKKIIKPGEQLPADVSDGKIKSLLANQSIEVAAVADEVDNAADLKEAARVEALIKRATQLGIGNAIAIKTEALEIMVADAEAKAIADAETKTVADTTTITGDGSGQALPDVSNSVKEAEGIEGAVTATLTGAVTKDGRVVELNALSVAALKKLATDLEIAGAAQLKKEALVEAITAVEFAAPVEE